MDIKELFLEFLDSKLLIYVLEIYLFGLIFYVVYSIINYFKYNSNANEKIRSFYAQMSEAERERAEAEKAKEEATKAKEEAEQNKTSNKDSSVKVKKAQ